jgi:hypothetical protein
VEFDLNAQKWIVNSQVVVPVRDYQYLIADSPDLQTRSSLFLISLDYIVYIEYLRHTAHTAHDTHGTRHTTQILVCGNVWHYSS